MFSMQSVSRNPLITTFPLSSAASLKITLKKGLNSLPNNKNCVWTKLKASADDRINLYEKLNLILGRVENIVRKGENGDYQHFLLFPQCFHKPSL